MSEIFDDRRKALEEEYFRRKEQETIEKMREQMAAEAEAAAAPKCPRCATVLTEIEHEGVKVERCPNCHGVWLDAGELEQLTRREEGGWLKWLAGE
ncbi:MAG TPA: zf-TFIIB domain-containing protein [Pyrinomonadaceae bacterium]|nr:zf-TFIIB domain-containing protein [Pyrinomonadaceae bacterium]